MKNLHKIKPALTDRHWALAHWCVGTKIKVDDTNEYYLNTSNRWIALDYEPFSWRIVLKEWIVAGRPKTQELLKNIVS